MTDLAPEEAVRRSSRNHVGGVMTDGPSEPSEERPTTYWHGGPLIRDSHLRPDDEGWVYVTPDYRLAVNYSSDQTSPWVHEVEPIGPIEQDPTSILSEGDSLRCRGGRIVRRVKPSNAEVDFYRAAVSAAHRMIGGHP